ncbi:hypothetical protein SPI_01754 [Niveomyces insectorum RCEF 264]|uniref:Uncharacterized protein n=1 Tax=Niveomyces insectorum RCEF 264 TaxID=1081102 RepID=A0A167Z752_9HYPO|nr:hypothetical protein SPI_01754 [Niveomyces insectorum RCEF 264]
MSTVPGTASEVATSNEHHPTSAGLPPDMPPSPVTLAAGHGGPGVGGNSINAGTNTNSNISNPAHHTASSSNSSSSTSSARRPSAYTHSHTRLPTHPPATNHGSFTAEMRDRQARGKDPYAVPGARAGPTSPLSPSAAVAASAALTSGSGGGSGSGSGSGSTAASGPTSSGQVWHQMYQQQPSRRIQNAFAASSPPLEDFETVSRRRHAALVLDSPELLMMYAQSMNDSIPATRLRFTRIMCGYDGDTPASATTASASVGVAAMAATAAAHGTRGGKSGGGGGGSKRQSGGSSTASKRKVSSLAS